MRGLVYPDRGELLDGRAIDERGGDVAAPVPVDGHRRYPRGLDRVEGEERSCQVWPHPRRVQAGGEKLVQRAGVHRSLPAAAATRATAPSARRESATAP